MKQTNYETRVLRVIDRYVNSYLRKRFSRAMRASIVDGVLCKTPSYRAAQMTFKQLHLKARQDLNRFVPWLHTLPNPLRFYPTGSMTGLITRALWAKLSDVSLEEAAKQVLAMMVPDATALDMECLLPLERTTREAKPASLVARRAEKANAMLVAWERKLKVAKNKVKKYRNKVKYYSKKGASQ